MRLDFLCITYFLFTTAGAVVSIGFPSYTVHLISQDPWQGQRNFPPAAERHILMHSSMRFVPGRRIEKIESKGVSSRVMVEFYGI